ncbi:hypothetical protein ASE08_03435 [Rhizobacter sp. Root16D2]|nr:hypothetical protein ASC88_21460 [Rhizobacter sp. Root29]KQW10892.1 hypothetical protein ASC98_02750 [Rhizobacter sp. Root1238]KRB25238.1 hypothetical protein ASE08_03435 [Rhizobacter sp. Root16D2]
MAAIVAILPPFVLLLILGDRIPSPETASHHPIIDSITTLIAAPLFESALLVPMMVMAERIVRGRIAPSLLCASIWAALHGMIIPAQAIVAFWAFLIFSLTLLHWRERLPNSYYWVLVLTHFFANLPSTILLAFDLV